MGLSTSVVALANDEICQYGQYVALNPTPTALSRVTLRPHRDLNEILGKDEIYFFFQPRQVLLPSQGVISRRKLYLQYAHNLKMLTYYELEYPAIFTMYVGVKFDDVIMNLSGADILYILQYPEYQQFYFEEVKSYTYVRILDDTSNYSAAVKRLWRLDARSDYFERSIIRTISTRGELPVEIEEQIQQYLLY